MYFKKIIFIGVLFSTQMIAQRFVEQVPQIKRYHQSEILDSVEGITIYNKLLESIGGDSVTFNKAGYNLQGWNEDYYQNGKLLHRGYYKDGKAVVFKNFYENGQCERTVINPDPLRCNIEIYYENGKQRKQISYYNGLPQKKYEYYQNGLPKYVEENEKEMQYLTLKKTWYSNGQVESSIELSDSNNKRYKQKIYSQTGKLLEEGNLVVNEKGDYIRDGVWNYYDTNGKKNKTEKYKNGNVGEK
jgi:antitoxin component YwqK of YwqJK toxin-antitoxin module